jgi:hypothetical protein
VEVAAKTKRAAAAHAGYNAFDEQDRSVSLLLGALQGVAAGCLMPFPLLLLRGDLLAGDKNQALAYVMLGSACFTAGFWGAKFLDLIDNALFNRFGMLAGLGKVNTPPKPDGG